MLPAMRHGGVLLFKSDSYLPMSFQILHFVCYNPGDAKSESDTMDLFSRQAEELLRRDAPLANRMRPTTLEEFTGQEHILGPGKRSARALTAAVLPVPL